MTPAVRRLLLISALLAAACASESPQDKPARAPAQESPLQRGDALLEAGKPLEAIAAYRAAGAGPRAARGLGLSYAALERWDEAHAAFAPYAPAHPSDGRGQIAWIKVLLGRGALDEARIAATAAAKVATDELELQLLAAALAHDPGERRAVLERLVALESKRPAQPGQARPPYELFAVRAELRRTLGDAAGAAADDALAEANGSLDPARIVDLASAYRRTQQTLVAGRLLARAAASEPAQPAVLRAFAEVSLELDAPERALDALRRMPAGGALSPVDEVLAARAQLALGQPQPAVERLRALVAVLEREQRTALAARARLWLSRALLAQGELSAAREALTPIADASVQLERDLALAEIELAAHHTDKARAVLASVLARQPESIAAHLLMASAEAAAGRAREAAAQLRALASARPQDARIALALALLLEGTGDAEGARVEYQRALALAPGSPTAWRALVARADARDEPLAGDALIREQSALAPRNATLQRMLGERLERRGDFSGAEAAFRAALEADDGRAEAWMAFADFYARNHKPARALELLEHVLKLKPDAADALVRAGAALARLGQVREAAARYERALRLRPSDVALQNTLAMLLAEDPAQRGRALALAEGAAAIAPSSPQVLYAFGYVRLRRNELALALPLLRGAAEAMPQHAEAQHRFALAQLLAGETEAGRRTLALARQLDPKLPPEDRALRELRD